MIEWTSYKYSNCQQRVPIEPLTPLKKNRYNEIMASADEGANYPERRVMQLSEEWGGHCKGAIIVTDVTGSGLHFWIADHVVNDYGVVVRADRDPEKTAQGSYYHCTDCGYDNTDIRDVCEESCWECGGGNLEYRSFT